MAGRLIARAWRIVRALRTDHPLRALAILSVSIAPVVVDSCRHVKTCADGTQIYYDFDKKVNCPEETGHAPLGHVRAPATPAAVISAGAAAVATHPLSVASGATVSPAVLAAAPDGSVWWADPSSGYIGRVSSAGAASSYISPHESYGLQPYSIALGPDGSTMWFIEANLGYAGDCALASIPEQGGGIHEYAAFPATSYPTDLTSGPGGDLWITEAHANDNVIDRYNPITHALKQFPVPVPAGANDVGLNDIVSGPDGRLWFLETTLSPAVVGALNPNTGAVTTYTVTGMASADSLTVGPDGNLWLAGDGLMARLTSTGKVALFPATSTQAQYPAGVVTGPDGDLWAVNLGGVVRLTTAGAATSFPLPNLHLGGSGIFTGASAAGPGGDVWLGAPGELVEVKLGTASAMISQQFSLRTSPSGPEGIAVGPSGHLWVTEDAVGKVADVSPSGSVVEHGLGVVRAHPAGIVQGPDGNLWVTETTWDKVARVTPAGAVSQFSLPNGSFPVGITSADGALWFVEQDTGELGRLTTDGTFSQYPISGSSALFDLALGPDGNLWITDGQLPAVFVVSPSAPGSATEIPMPSGSTPGVITPGPDGNMWVGDLGSSTIDRITVAAPHTVTQLQAGAAGPGGLTLAGGDFWFTEPGSSALGEMTPQGTVTEYEDTAHLEYLSGLTTDASGNVWYVQTFGSKVGEVLLGRPTVSGFTPAAGIAGSTLVTISGTNLGYASQVRFGGVAAPILRQYGSQLVVQVPRGALPGRLSVTTQAGTATSPTSFPVSLSVTSLSPSSGPYGTQVAISGTGFTPSSTVKFGGASASAVSYVSGTKLLATVPPAASAGPVSVGTSAGVTRSAGSFYVTPHISPRITAISPVSGITGSFVAITGGYFSGASAVHFGSLPARFDVVYPNRVVARVPSGASAGAVSVTTAAGTATSSNTFTPTLSITGFSPSSGGAGTVVTVHGVGFNTSSTVRFDGTPAASTEYVSAGELQATVPTGAGTGPVSVTNTAAPAGTVQSAKDFG